MTGISRCASVGIRSILFCWLAGGASVFAQAPATQPTASTRPRQPALAALLKQQWDLDADRDLRNPLIEGVAPAAVFRKANAKNPVAFQPVIALGSQEPTRAGWYRASDKAGALPDTTDLSQFKHEVWSYQFKQPQSEIKSGQFTLPPLASGSKTFDPGNEPFGLWVSNDKFTDAGVFTQPGLTERLNQRLKTQPNNVRIYPNMDPATHRLVPNSYLLAWEYTGDADFQDVITRIDNVRLLPADPPLIGILAPVATVAKLAGGFQFVEGPAWDFKNNALYFSDIPPAQIIRFADGKHAVANAASGQSNGLMFDKQGMLVACEHAGRRLSRAVPGQPGKDIVTHYQGKKLNSPNDLWIDAAGGIYFTDPRYGGPDDREIDKEAVYYVTSDGQITQIIDDLVRPNGIALSPDGKLLYVVDNGAHSLHCYPITEPGKIGPGARIAYVTHPDGMTVDVKGRLYVTGEGGVWVLDANAKWIGLIETPELPANCTFGGPGYKTLYITARTSLYAIETHTRGWHVHLDGPPPQ